MREGGNHSGPELPITSSVYVRENQGTERCCMLLKVTQLVSGRAETYPGDIIATLFHCPLYHRASTSYYLHIIFYAVIC